jgi:hypothetical protein
MAHIEPKLGASETAQGPAAGETGQVLIDDDHPRDCWPIYGLTFLSRVDARLVVVPLEVPEARQLDQVRIALVVLREKGQVGVALLLRVPVVGDVDLTADDRLDALGPGSLDEVDGACEGAVVGERHRRHLELRRALRRGRDPARSVEDRVLGVDVEVDERDGLGHGDAMLLGGPDGTLKRENAPISGPSRRVRAAPEQPIPFGKDRHQRPVGNLDSRVPARFDLESAERRWLDQLLA